MNDEGYMQLAINAAEEAAARGDVPVGAAFVWDEIVVVRGNRRRSSGDPTAHAEIRALRDAAKVIGNWRCEGTLYVTQEPCPMCAGAIVNARIKRLVFGCASPKSGGVGSLFSIPTDPRLNHRCDVTAGVLEEECAHQLKQFFAKLRSRA